jgi:hypothetical protein
MGFNIGSTWHMRYVNHVCRQINPYREGSKIMSSLIALKGCIVSLASYYYPELGHVTGRLYFDRHVHVDPWYVYANGVFYRFGADEVMSISGATIVISAQ